MLSLAARIIVAARLRVATLSVRWFLKPEIEHLNHRCLNPKSADVKPAKLLPPCGIEVEGVSESGFERLGAWV